MNETTNDMILKAGAGVTGTTWSVMGLPWDTMAAIATVIYMGFCIYQKIREIRAS